MRRFSFDLSTIKGELNSFLRTDTSTPSSQAKTQKTVELRCRFGDHIIQRPQFSVIGALRESNQCRCLGLSRLPYRAWRVATPQFRKTALGGPSILAGFCNGGAL